MKLFACQNCGQVLHFENTVCVSCGLRLGYLPDQGTLSAVKADGANWTALACLRQLYRFCANWERSACNWLVAADAENPFCIACRHNRTIPDITQPANHARWQKIEDAKRRLFYSLIKFNLPAPTADSGDGEPLVFDFLADLPQAGARVLTGHDAGLITIALSEADDAERERMRTNLNEPYRTLLGHFRHEVGHYYWDRLIRDTGHVEDFRTVFGDERADYATALKHHYEHGPRQGWQESYISAYAASHPWEDWAESFAHYLHMVDTLEMATAFGLAVAPLPEAERRLTARFAGDPYEAPALAPLIEAWLPLSVAVNALNRAMGQPDLYPFVLSPAAIGKMEFVHDAVRRRPDKTMAPC